MILAVQSTPWLLAQEMRLAWRAVVSAKGMKWRAPMLFGVFLLCCGFIGAPVGLALRGVAIPVTNSISLIAVLLAAAVFSLMLSQSLAEATQTLYARGDLDLLFASPMAPGRVLFTRCAAIAVKVFGAFAILATPVLAPVAMLGHPAWLASYAVLAALALGSTGVGLGAAIVLFRVIGPRRTRAVAQVLAAVIGAGMFLVVQARTLLGGSKTAQIADLIAQSIRDTAPAPEALSWPLRAMMGDALPLLLIALAGAATFLLAVGLVGQRFASDAAAASGVAAPGSSATAKVADFADGAFRAAFAKEWRLLVRDVPLLAQVLLRLLYLAPLMFLLLRNAAAHGGWRLASGVGLITFVTSQLAGSLAWITVAAEEAPELLACAPAAPRLVRRAKLSAALAPLSVLVPPLVALAALAPAAGAAATMGCAAAALTSALICTRLQKPAKRSDFRRRGGAGSVVAAIAELFSGVVIAGLATLSTHWPSVLIAPLAIVIAVALALWT